MKFNRLDRYLFRGNKLYVSDCYMYEVLVREAHKRRFDGLFWLENDFKSVTLTFLFA